MTSRSNFRESNAGRSTLVLMICTTISRILGYVRVAVIAAVFGASGIADVLNAVYLIPNNLRKLLAEGAFSSAMIPELAQVIETNNKDQTNLQRELVRRLLTMLAVVLTFIVIVVILLARPVAAMLLDFPEPWKMNMAVQILPLVFPYLLLVSISAVLMAVLNCHESFVVPALSPTFFSLSVILSIVLFYKHWGLLSAAFGILAGGVGGIVIQLPSFFLRGYDLRLNFHWSDDRVVRIVRRWLPVLASASVFAISQQVAVLFASGLEDGSISALANALVFWQLPFGILSVSVMTSHFPRMSRASAAGDSYELVKTFTSGLKLILSFLVPPTIFYLFFGEEVIRVLLERLNFTLSASILTNSVLASYTLGLIGVGLFTFIQRYFFSIGNYRIPFFVSMIVVVIDIPLSFILKETTLRVAGLGLANSIAFSIGTLILLQLSWKGISHPDKQHFPAFLKRIFILIAALSTSFWAFNHIVEAMWSINSLWENTLLLVILLLAAIAITLIFYRILRLGWWTN